jgi:two-component system, response regulator
VLTINNKTILLVEDNDDDIILTKRAFEKKLKNHVYTLSVVKNGKDAIQYLEKEPLPYLILLDLNLPYIDGFKVLEYIRSHKHTKLIPVIILTSSKERKDIQRVYSLGANSYIQKPVDAKKFYDLADLIHDYWININQNPILNSN